MEPPERAVKFARMDNDAFAAAVARPGKRYTAPAPAGAGLAGELTGSVESA